MPENNFIDNPQIQHVFTPEAPTTSGGTPPASEVDDNQKPNKKKHTSRKVLIGVGGAVVAAAVATPFVIGAFAGNNNHGNGNGTKPPEATSSAAPVKWEAVADGTLAQEQLPTGATPEVTAETFEARITAWKNAGKTEANRTAFSAGGGNIAVVNELADANAAIFAPALFGPDWDKNDQIKSVVKSIRDDNAFTLQMWFETHNSGKYVNGNKEEGYEQFTKVDPSSTKIIDSSPTTPVVELVYTVGDNVDKTRVKQLAPNYVAYSPDPVSVDISLNMTGGSPIVTDLENGNK